MKRKGFTLIEMMIVMIIIGILAGLIATGAFRSIEDARRSQAQAAISALETALAMYESDVGDYPPPGVAWSGGNNFKTWLQDGDGSTGWNGPYMNFTSAELSGNSYQDPWDVAYDYEVHDPTNNPASYFDLWSTGSDGADIINW